MRGDVRGGADGADDLCDSPKASAIPMTFLMHWLFKTGYHEIAAKKFLATGAPFPECLDWEVTPVLTDEQAWPLTS